MWSRCGRPRRSYPAQGVSIYQKNDGRDSYNSEPRENHRNRLIDEFNHQHKLANEAVITTEDLVEVGNGVNCSEETAIQPTTTLKNELGHLIRHVGFTSRRLDVLKKPSALPLGDNLEAQDSILSQVHVGCEDTGIGTVHLFA